MPGATFILVLLAVNCPAAPAGAAAIPYCEYVTTSLSMPNLLPFIIPSFYLTQRYKIYSQM